jgi:hypothetical protein
MIEAIEAWSGLVAVLLSLSILFSTLFIWVGVLPAKKKDLSFRRILCAAVAGSTTTYGFTVLLVALFRLDSRISFSLGLLLSLIAVGIVLRLHFPVPAAMIALSIAAQILALWLGVSLFVGGMKDLLDML